MLKRFYGAERTDAQDVVANLLFMTLGAVGTKTYSTRAGVRSAAAGQRGAEVGRRR
jgi:hypothetical protein